MKLTPTAASIWLQLLLCTQVSADGCVTMLADVSGRVAVADAASARPADWWPVQLLQCLPARKVLALQDGARATLFFPTAGMAVDLSGGGRFEVLEDTVRAIGNAPQPQPRALNSAFRRIQVDRSNLSSAGVRMRLPATASAPAAIAPRGIVYPKDAVVFSWEPVAGASQYRFQLARGATEMLYDATTDRTEVALPPQVQLTPGERLKWRVDVADDKVMSARWHEFIIATDAVRSLAAELDSQVPSPSAAERNLRDVLLMQRMEQN